MAEREKSHEEDNDVGKEVAWVERPHKDHEQDHVRFRQPWVLMEEERSLELVDFYQKVG